MTLLSIEFWNFTSIISSVAISILLVLVLRQKEEFPNAAVPFGLMFSGLVVAVLSAALLITSWASHAFDESPRVGAINTILTICTIVLAYTDLVAKPERGITKVALAGIVVAALGIVFGSSSWEIFVATTGAALLGTLGVYVVLLMLSRCGALEWAEKILSRPQKWLDARTPWLANWNNERKTHFNSV